MDKKKVTFLVMSDRKGVTQRLVVSAAWLKVAGVMSAILLVVSAAAIVDYGGLLIQSVENKRLKAENLQLRNQFRAVESKLDGLEASLARIQTFTTKLKLITDTNDSDRTLKLTMRPREMPTEILEDHQQPLETRQPSSVLAREDAVFFDKAPLETERGEVAKEMPRDYATLSVRIDRNIKLTNMREQNVLELIEILSNRQSLLRATPALKPASGWFTSPFGYRVNPTTGQATLHEGLDIAAAPGTPVHAPADGVVSFAGYDEGYGKLVSVDHGYGIVTRYGHNSQLFVVVGQKIKRGDVISAVGNTGRSTGPHVHYEVRLNDVPVDPINYILDE